MKNLFLEVTERGDKTKSLINIDKIISIGEDENGLAVIVLAISSDCDSTSTLACLETYIEIFNTLCEMELV